MCEWHLKQPLMLCRLIIVDFCVYGTYCTLSTYSVIKSLVKGSIHWKYSLIQEGSKDLVCLERVVKTGKKFTTDFNLQVNELKKKAKQLNCIANNSIIHDQPFSEVGA